jgi:hypothetical protein
MAVAMAPYAVAMTMVVAGLLDEARALTSANSVETADCRSSVRGFSKTESKCGDSGRSQQRFHIFSSSEPFGAIQGSLK